MKSSFFLSKEFFGKRNTRTVFGVISKAVKHQLKGNKMRTITINDKMQITEGDDSIFRYVAINNCTLDMDTLEKMTEIGDTWCGSRLCGNLIDIRNMLFVDSKTRSYAAAQYREHVAGTAIVLESKISSYFANVYLKFSQPKTPTRLFTKEAEAVEWLLEQMRDRATSMYS
jgi:hypothetical protein